MELIYFLTAFLVFFSVLIQILSKSKPKKLPPGPRPLPIIGNMHQLYGSPIHHKLRDLANKYGPLMYLQLGEISNIIVSSPEVAKEFFKTHDITFSQRPSYSIAFKTISYDFTDIIFAPYGTYWKNIRKICMMELLSPKRVQSFRPIREEEVLRLVRSLSQQNGSVVNLGKKIFSFTYGITARTAFGKRSKDEKEFIQVVEQINDLVAGFNIGDLYPSVKFLQNLGGFRYKLEAAAKLVDEILGKVLIDHRKQLKERVDGEAACENLVDVLLNIQKSSADFNPPLTDNSVKAVIFDMFSAGGESSSISLEWAMSELIKNPAVMQRAQEEVRRIYDEKGNVDESRLHELKYLEAIIKETFRLRPSAPLLVPRECGEQCEINGFEIPAKARVIVNAWAIGRDPNYWTEPEKFNPDRFLDCEIDFRGNNFEFIPFGAGRRMCPGVAFAISNIELPLAQLLFHFDWKLSGDLKPEQLDMTEATGVTVRRKNELYAIPVTYHRSSLK